MARIQQNERGDVRFRYLTLALAWILCIGFAATGTRAQTRSAGEGNTVIQQSVHENENVTYIRPNFHQRLHGYLLSTFGAMQMGRTAFGAAISQADGVPPDWGQGWGPYGERFASHFGSATVTGGANLVLSEALREDTKYYPCTCKGIWPRLKHALSSSATARAGEDGHRVFSVPAFASPYAGAFAKLAWYPPRFGPKDSFRNGNYELLDSVGMKVALEFLSPLLHKFHL